MSQIHAYVALGFDCLVTANPLQEWAAGFATDDKVSRRTNIIIDIDRRTGTDRTATREEILAAEKYGHELIEWLIQRLNDIRIRCITCSGNGIHILIACDLENNESARSEVSRFIKNLQKAVPSDHFKLDVSVSNASRHVRLIGTPNFKFKNPQPTLLLANPKPDGKSLLSDDLVLFNSCFSEESKDYSINLTSQEFIVPSVSVVERARRYLAAYPPAISGMNGHKTLLVAASRLRKSFLLDFETSLELLKEYNMRCEPPWEEHDLRRKLREAEKSPLREGELLLASAYDSIAPTTYSINKSEEEVSQMNQNDAQLPVLRSTELNPPPSRIKVYMNGNIDLHDKVAQIKPVLSQMPELFEFGNELVRIDSKTVDDVIGGVASWSVARTPKVAWLSSQIPKYVDFCVYDKKGRLVRVAPKDRLYQALLEDVDWSSIRSLKGFATTPIYRPDGTFHDQPGFDYITGYWNSARIPLNLTDHLNQDDARSSAGRLLELVQDFPFKEDAYRNVWLGICLTLVARPGIDDAVPSFLISANNRGTGKTLLVRLASFLARGTDCPMTTWPEPTNDKSKGAIDNEVNKILVAIMKSGQSILAFDNIRSGTNFGSPSLDAATTCGIFQGRILSTSDTEALPWRTVTIGTGNNVGLQSDSGRRTWPIYLETNLENPELRSGFVHSELLDHVRSNWFELYKCLAVILAAHAQAGRPGPSNSPPRSFSKWHNIVRDAIWWATGVDFNQILMNEEIVDEELQEESRLLRLLLEYQQTQENNWFTARGIQESLLHSNGQWESLRDIFCPDSKENPTINAISRKLTKTKNTVRGGLKLTARSNKATKTMEFHVEEMT